MLTGGRHQWGRLRNHEGRGRRSSWDAINRASDLRGNCRIFLQFHWRGWPEAPAVGPQLQVPDGEFHPATERPPSQIPEEVGESDDKAAQQEQRHHIHTQKQVQQRQASDQHALDGHNRCGHNIINFSVFFFALCLWKSESLISRKVESQDVSSRFNYSRLLARKTQRGNYCLWRRVLLFVKISWVWVHTCSSFDSQIFHFGGEIERHEKTGEHYASHHHD